MTRRPPLPPLFPYTTLFRSSISRPALRPYWIWIPAAVSTPSIFATRSMRVYFKGRECRSSVNRSINEPATTILTTNRCAFSDRKSTRLNSSHQIISYAVFCLNDSAPTATSTLSLHDALPIFDLEAGFTTVLDMDSRGGFNTVDLRDAINAGLLQGPRMQVVGQSINQRAGNYYPDDQSVRFLRSEEHTSELQSPDHLVCRLLLE